MIDTSSKEWLVIDKEIDRLLKQANAALRVGVRDNRDADLAATWSARGQIIALELLKKLPEKQAKESQ